MKLSLVMLAVLGYPSSVALWAAETPRSTCDSLIGVWDYVEPSPAGRAVIAKLGTKYTVAFIQAPSPAGAPEPATDAEKAARYSASGAGAFDYSCEGVQRKVSVADARTPLSEAAGGGLLANLRNGAPGRHCDLVVP